MKIWMLMNERTISLYHQDVERTVALNEAHLLIKAVKKIDVLFLYNKEEETHLLKATPLSLHERRHLQHNHQQRAQVSYSACNKDVLSFVSVTAAMQQLIHSIQIQHKPILLSLKHVLATASLNNKGKAVNVTFGNDSFFGMINQQNQFVCTHNHNEETLAQYLSTHHDEKNGELVSLSNDELAFHSRDKLHVQASTRLALSQRCFYFSLAALFLSLVAFVTQASMKDKAVSEMQLDKLERRAKLVETIQQRELKDTHFYQQHLVLLGRALANHTHIQVLGLQYSQLTFRVKGQVDQRITHQVWQDRLDQLPGEIELIKDPFSVFESAEDSVKTFELVWQANGA